MNRAYSTLEIREVSDSADKREIVGIASTPTVDRMNDIVEPKGAEFNLPIPLLWQHDSRQPLGHVTYAKATKAGIEIRATLVRIEEAGTLKERLDEAWQSIKSGLVRGLSIGFKPIEYSRLENGDGLRFIKWLWLELSAVTIPANGDCSITAIKSIDRALLAASGKQQAMTVRLINPPGVSGLSRPKEGSKVKTIAEQISAREATRQQKAARMVDIMSAATEEGSTLDAEQQEEFDTLEREVEALDKDLKRLRTLERLSVDAARPAAGASPSDAVESRAVSTGPRVQITGPKMEKGIAFARYVGAVALSRGNLMQAVETSKRWKDSTPEVEMVLRAAVSAGTTTASTWAEPLVQYQQMSAEFVEYLRPNTIIGRINGFRRVPFKIKVPRQTGGATAGWVGEGKAKPLSSLAFDSITMDFTKLAGIVPLTEELVRFSTPNAETIVRDDLAAAIIQLMDRDFVDPTKAAAATVSPASITNGVTGVIATGTTAAALREDLGMLLASFATADVNYATGHFIMHPTTALRLGLMRNALDQPEFPNIGVMGGTLEGFPVVVSTNVPAAGGSPANGYPIIFVIASEILLADDGQVEIDASREASLQMDSAPDSPPTASTVLVSLWQHNMVAIKAERFINWAKRRSQAAGYIVAANYGT